MRTQLITKYPPKGEVKNTKIAISPSSKVSAESINETRFNNTIIVSIRDSDFINWLLFHCIIFDEHEPITYYQRRSNYKIDNTGGSNKGSVDYERLYKQMFDTAGYLKNEKQLSYFELYGKFKKEVTDNKRFINFLKSYFLSSELESISFNSEPSKVILNYKYWEITICYAILDNLINKDRKNCDSEYECEECDKSFKQH